MAASSIPNAVLHFASVAPSIRVFLEIARLSAIGELKGAATQGTRGFGWFTAFSRYTPTLPPRPSPTAPRSRSPRPPASFRVEGAEMTKYKAEDGVAPSRKHSSFRFPPSGLRLKRPRPCSPPGRQTWRAFLRLRSVPLPAHPLNRDPDSLRGRAGLPLHSAPGFRNSPRLPGTTSARVARW